jgi:hypothetical protein
LNAKIDAYVAQRPTKLMIRFQPKARQKVIFSKSEIPVPPDLPLILGDAVHNLCAALDFTMYIILKDVAPSHWEIKFPFSRKRAGFENAMDKAQIKFARKEIQDFVRSLKPWLDTDGSQSLNGMHRIDLSDKHKLLVMTPEFLSIPIEEFAKLGYPVGNMPGKTTIAIPNSKDGMAITLTGVNFGLRRNRRAMGDWEEEAKIETSTAVVFGHGQPFEHYAVQPVLKKMVNDVESIVNVLIDLHLK